MSVLIVEDEGLICALLEDALEEAGFEVAGCASSVGEAIDALDRLGIDLVTLDFNLQGEVSTPVAERIKALGIPFVVTSGYASSDLPECVRDVPFFPKPFSPEEVVAALRRLSAERERTEVRDAALV